MSFMMAFAIASVMLGIGIFLRAKVPVLRNMLVPAAVIAGVLGIVFMNVLQALDLSIGTDASMFTEIVNQLFTVSFISISLTGTGGGNSGTAKNILKGAVGLGIIWCLLYALTPLAATGIIALLGSVTDMEPIYGTLVQFAFCQGPGQAVAYGNIFEQFGVEDATTVAVAYAAIGFIAAFGVGVPIAKFGIKKGIAKNCGQINESILKGYLRKDEQTELMIKDTTCTSNIETLSFHFVMIGICYLFAVLIGKLFSLIPGFLGTSMGNMMFMNGMYAAYIVKFLMKKMNLDFLISNTLQNKITGWTSDYLVVCSFMAVSVSVLRNWIGVMLLVSAVVVIVTFLVCFYFGCRIGGDNDFERTLGAYGMCTGTVPSGVALVRIVDPDFHTATAIELGACNLVMLASTPVYILVLALASGTIGMGVTMAGLAGCAVIYLVILKLTKSWGKPTFRWK